MAKPGPKPGNRQPIGDRLERSVEIDPVTECWEWQLSKNKLGYGLMRYENKMRTPHRVSYEYYNNTTIPPGMCVCHTCDNPSCINPNHLWLGTRQDNTKDMESKDRQMYFGHKSMVGVSRPKKTCVHCGHVGPDTQIGKYHNNKCAKKPKHK